MISASVGCIGIVRFLLARNCNSNACNENNQRPLHYACSRNHVDVSRRRKRRRILLWFCFCWFYYATTQRQSGKWLLTKRWRGFCSSTAPSAMQSTNTATRLFIEPPRLARSRYASCSSTSSRRAWTLPTPKATRLCTFVLFVFSIWHF